MESYLITKITSKNYQLAHRTTHCRLTISCESIPVQSIASGSLAKNVSRGDGFMARKVEFSGGKEC